MKRFEKSDDLIGAVLFLTFFDASGMVTGHILKSMGVGAPFIGNFNLLIFSQGFIKKREWIVFQFNDIKLKGIVLYKNL